MKCQYPAYKCICRDKNKIPYILKNNKFEWVYEFFKWIVSFCGGLLGLSLFFIIFVWIIAAIASCGRG